MFRQSGRNFEEGGEKGGKKIIVKKVGRRNKVRNYNDNVEKEKV